jgi:prepilin peptidase CpaA
MRLDFQANTKKQFNRLNQCRVTHMVMMPHEAFATLALLVLVFAATVVDLRRHRIPNFFTAGFALLGFFTQYALYGFPGVRSGAIGFLVPLALLVPFYAVRWMGAGDVKLAASAGIFLGWPNSLLAVGLSLGFGSLAAFMLLAANGGLKALISRYAVMAKSLLTTGDFAYIAPAPGDQAARRFPYAFVIALGTVATLWWAGRMEPFIRDLEGLPHAW